MKKILFVMPTLRDGGAERSLVNLLTELPEDKYEIGLLIDMIFEVLLGTGATWICLLLINHLYEFIYEREGS